jgi:hypothetical protein
MITNQLLMHTGALGDVQASGKYVEPAPDLSFIARCLRSSSRFIHFNKFYYFRLRMYLTLRFLATRNLTPTHTGSLDMLSESPWTGVGYVTCRNMHRPVSLPSFLLRYIIYWTLDIGDISLFIYKHYRKPIRCNNNGLLIIPVSATCFGQLVGLSSGALECFLQLVV